MAQYIHILAYLGSGDICSERERESIVALFGDVEVDSIVLPSGWVDNDTGSN